MNSVYKSPDWIRFALGEIIVGSMCILSGVFVVVGMFYLPILLWIVDFMVVFVLCLVGIKEIFAGIHNHRMLSKEHEQRKLDIVRDVLES